MGPARCWRNITNLRVTCIGLGGAEGVGGLILTKWEGGGRNSYYKNRRHHYERLKCWLRPSVVAYSIPLYHSKLKTLVFLSFQDNCPFTPNSDQKDSDWDRIGDECDSCPLTENANQEAICLDDRDYDGEHITWTFYFGRIIFGHFLSHFG